METGGEIKCGCDAEKRLARVKKIIDENKECYEKIGALRKESDSLYETIKNNAQSIRDDVDALIAYHLKRLGIEFLTETSFVLEVPANAAIPSFVGYESYPRLIGGNHEGPQEIVYLNRAAIDANGIPIPAHGMKCMTITIKRFRPDSVEHLEVLVENQ